MSIYKGFKIISHKTKMNWKVYFKIFYYVVLVHLVVLSLFITIFFYISEREILDYYLSYFQSQLSKIKIFNILNRDFNFNFDSIDHPSFTKIKQIFGISFITYSFFFIAVWYFRELEKELTEEKIKRGAKSVSPTEFMKQIPQEHQNIPASRKMLLPAAWKSQHCFVAGSSGTGKTTLLSAVIQYLIDQEKKVIIYDAKGGEFVAKFYDSSKHYIYNPFDSRSIHWNVFDGIKSEPQFELSASALIPTLADDKYDFFNKGARSIFAGILRYCYYNNQADNLHVHQLLSASPEDLKEHLMEINSPAVKFIANPASSTTQSILAVLEQYADIFKYLVNHQKQPVFSLKDWVHDSSKKGCIFLPNNPLQQEILKSVYSLFLNSLTNEVMSRRDIKEDPGQEELYCIIDEIATLQKMDAIKKIFPLSRSKGFSTWTGLQEKTQLNEIYGRNLSSSLLNQCNYIVFRINDDENANSFSHMFGEKEIEKLEPVYSLGQDDDRDGESLRKEVKKEWLIIPSEIQNLPDFDFYIKLQGLDITKSSIKRVDYQDKNLPFIENEFFRAKKNDKNYKKKDPPKETEAPQPNKNTSVDDLSDNPLASRTL